MESERTHKKKQAAAERKLQAEKRRNDIERQKQVRLAFAILSKLSSAAVNDLAETTKDPFWKHIPDWAKQQAKEVFEEIANVSASVKAVTTTAKAPPLKHTIEEATGPEC